MTALPQDVNIAVDTMIEVSTAACCPSGTDAEQEVNEAMSTGGMRGLTSTKSWQPTLDCATQIQPRRTVDQAVR